MAVIAHDIGDTKFDAKDGLQVANGDAAGNRQAV
jgi:hypothetical protein